MTFQLPQNFAVGDAFQALNAHANDDNLAEGIGQSYGVIGYKGKNWTLRYRGKIKPFIRPDDGTPASYIDVIILGSPAKKSKSYYPKYVPGQSDGERPICSSYLGDVPDADVTKQQSTSCALCPRNKWLTDPTGRKSRECTDYKRLAVLIMPKISEALLGTPLLEPVFLRVPPDSLQALAQMGDFMGKQHLHYSAYVTRISFDQTKAHPSMIFTPQQGLSNDEAPVILGMRENPVVDRIMYGDLPLGGVAAVAAANALNPANYQPTGLLAAVANQQALPAPALQVVPSNVVPLVPLKEQNVDFAYAEMATDITLDGNKAVAQSLREQLLPAAVTQADVGNVELSDADLDARLAKMIASGKR